jgi:Icc-related predicted phosphoesterase
VRIFFATDIHGSEVCWRKFLNSAAFYRADVIVLGGDLTGKIMVPIVAHRDHWEVVMHGRTEELRTRQELADVERRIRDRGSYPIVVTPDELASLGEREGAVDRRFTREMLHSLGRWLDMAEEKLGTGRTRCVVNCGNDDIWEADALIESQSCVSLAEGRVIDLDGFPLISMGWTNPTPWNTFREAPEERLAAKIDEMADQVGDMDRAIFNFHAPPHGTGLDEAPALDERLRPIHGGAVMRPVGSTAVRKAILDRQPMLSLHGHIHESRGASRLGRTISINPGSVYADGVLQGAVVNLNAKKRKVAQYILVNG